MKKMVVIRSESLGQNVICVRDFTGVLAQCEDGTIYDDEEMRILLRDGGELPLAAHLVKKVFDGRIVSARTQKPVTNPRWFAAQKQGETHGTDDKNQRH